MPMPAAQQEVNASLTILRSALLSCRSWSSRPIAFAVLVLVFTACGGGSEESAERPPSASSTTGDSDEQMPSIESGSEVEFSKNSAPNFDFILFQGEAELGASQLDLAGLRGKPVVLNFWAGLCPPCRAEMPDLQEFHEEFQGRVTLVGIDLGLFTGLGSQKDAKNLLIELGVTYPVGFTEDVSVISKYKVLGMPTTIFIDAEGEVFKSWGGALNLDVLREQTNAMLDQ